MSNIEQLIQIDFKQLFIWLVLILLVAKTLVDSFSGTIGKWLKNKDIETKSMREKREYHEMVLSNAQSIKELAEIHKRDNDISNEHDDKLREDMTKFMTEVRSDIGELKDSLQETFNNRKNDRQVSIEREQRLSNRIDTLVDASKQRDVSIETISNGLEKLTKMFIDGQISDMRHRILNFAASISSGKKYNLEAYEYTLQTYRDYERILKEHNMTNGLVEESVEYIRSAYQEHLKNGDFGNYRL